MVLNIVSSTILYAPYTLSFLCVLFIRIQWKICVKPSEFYNNQINARAQIGHQLWFIVLVNTGFVNHSPAARDLQILLVFYQHPAWFISL